MSSSSPLHQKEQYSPQHKFISTFLPSYTTATLYPFPRHPSKILSARRLWIIPETLLTPLVELTQTRSRDAGSMSRGICNEELTGWGQIQMHKPSILQSSCGRDAMGLSVMLRAANGSTAWRSHDWWREFSPNLFSYLYVFLWNISFTRSVWQCCE